MTAINKTEKEKLNPRTTFWKCGACSHAMFHLLNHEFGHIKEDEEKASDLLAGGIAQKGYQCGMLWGAALAAGAESSRRYKDVNEATSSAILVSKELVQSFINRTKTPDCRDISRVDWESRLQMYIYMVKTVMRGFIFSPCFNLIVKWTPEATDAAYRAFTERPSLKGETTLSCASEVVRKMGGNEEEAIMVAGFAGGIGLSGNACGALSAAIWYKMLKQSRTNPSKAITFFNNPDVKQVFRIFYMQTDSEMLCSKICGKQIKSVEEHTEYLKSGGCSKIIDALSTV